MLSRTLRMTTVHNNGQGVDQGPPHPSVRLPRDCLAGQSVGGPYTIPIASSGHHCRYGRVSSDSATLSATRLTRPHKPTCINTIQYLLIEAQPTRSLIDSGGGYHLRSFEHDNRPLPDLPIRYSPLSPNCPARSHNCTSTNHYF